EGEDPAPTPAAPVATATTTRDAEPPPGPLEVVSWGRSSGQLAVVVRNGTSDLLARARVRIVARDAEGRVVLREAGTPRDVCCTVVGLPPGGEFGLFAELGRDVGRIAGVEVVPLAT